MVVALETYERSGSGTNRAVDAQKAEHTLHQGLALSWSFGCSLQHVVCQMIWNGSAIDLMWKNAQLRRSKPCFVLRSTKIDTWLSFR